jgi:hypothetical protein
MLSVTDSNSCESQALSDLFAIGSELSRTVTPKGRDRPDSKQCDWLATWLVDRSTPSLTAEGRVAQNDPSWTLRRSAYGTGSC